MHKEDIIEACVALARWIAVRVNCAPNEKQSETRMINFKGHRFEKSIILLRVRWYLAYSPSYRNLEEMMQERGVEVDHSNIYRWIE